MTTLVWTPDVPHHLRDSVDKLLFKTKVNISNSFGLTVHPVPKRWLTVHQSHRVDCSSVLTLGNCSDQFHVALFIRPHHLVDCPTKKNARFSLGRILSVSRGKLSPKLLGKPIFNNVMYMLSCFWSQKLLKIGFPMRIELENCTVLSLHKSGFNRNEAWQTSTMLNFSINPWGLQHHFMGTSASTTPLFTAKGRTQSNRIQVNNIKNISILPFMIMELHVIIYSDISQDYKL